MVFESIVTDVLNRFLGDYIENLDSKQLKLGIWGGDVVLRNLILKQTALSELDLPVQTVYGRLDKLVLKIPWKNLYGASVEATVEGLYLLVKPNSDVKYDEQKEEKRQFDEKQAKLLKIEEAKKLAKAPQKTDDTFVEKLVTQIIKNVQLSIKNIHIRYEENRPTPEVPFAMGITLSNLVVQTTDENWCATVVQEMVSKIFKVVSMDGLSIYWNCNTEMFCNLHPDELSKIFIRDIATKETVPEKYKYILGPINSEARLILNPKPENDERPFSIPKAHAELVIQKLSLGIEKSQYQDIVSFVDSMSFQSRGIPYRKYRPDLKTYKEDYKAWWKFAFTCILETQIRRKKRNWDWVHMLEHRELCRQYGENYKNKLQIKKPTKDILDSLNDMEKKMDLFNIILIRERIELEVERMDKLRESQQPKGWFTGWWKRGSVDNTELEESADILMKFQKAMTSEEKRKLFSAIDYNENMSPLIYPESYVDTVVQFHLQKFEVNIKDDTVADSSVILSKLDSVKCRVESRPMKNGLKVAVCIEKLKVEGAHYEDTIPEIINSGSEDENEKSALLDLLFELNPIDCNFDQRVHLTVNPVRVIYDARTINQCLNVFKIPQSTLDELSQLAAAKVTDVKNMSAIGLQHVIEQHTRLDLKLNVSAPYVLVPFGGRYRGAENLIVLNLGKLSITSIVNESEMNVRDMHKQGLAKEDVISTLMLRSYDRFQLELTNIQVLIVQGDENWRKHIFEVQEVSPMHLLTPLNLHVTFENCLIADDPKMPLKKITAEIPSVQINITDARMLLLLTLINSIPMGDDINQEFDRLSLRTMSSASLHKFMEYENVHIPLTQERKDKSVGIEMTELEAVFVLKELNITLSHQEILSAPTTNVIMFNLNNTSCKFVKQTFNMDLDITLSSISINQFFNDDLMNLLTTPAGDDLVNLKFQQVEKKSPNFISKHNSCEMLLKVQLAKLRVRLHQEALHNLMKYATELQKQMEEVQNDKSQSSRYTRQRSTSSSARNVVISNVEKRRAKKKSKSDSILFMLVANLEELSVTLENKISPISRIAINGIFSEIVMKFSHTQVGVSLNNITLLDLNEKTYYKKILTSDIDKKVLKMNVILHNNNDEANDDIVITASIGCIRVTFINWYINNMINFLNQFQMARSAILAASEQVAKSAKENVTTLYEKATKVKLDVKINAPEIIIPENSHCFRGLLIDLGHIIITNEFQTLKVQSEAGDNAIVDELLMKLENLNLVRIQLNDQLEILNKVMLLQPVSFSLSVHRNLSLWYKSIPNIDVDGNIDTIQLMVGELDYRTIMKILSGNMTEGTNEVDEVESVLHIERSEHSLLISMESETFDRRQSTAQKNSKLDEDQHVHTLFRWNFVMKSFKINLFTTNVETIGARKVSDIDNYRIGLAELALEGFAVCGRMLSNNSISNTLLLVNCLLIDTRPGREDKINCMLSRVVDESESEKAENCLIGTSRNMIDITYQQKNVDKFVDVRVYSFTFILSVEYLLKLSNFFTSALEQQQVDATKQTPSRISVASKVQEVEAIKSMFTMTLKLEKPYIILVEHMDTINSRSLILNCEALVKLRINHGQTNITGCITDMQMYTCIFDSALRDKTKSMVLSPVTIQMAGSTPEDTGLHMEVILTDIHISVSLFTIELLNNIMMTLSSSSSEEVQIEDHMIDYSDLWETNENLQDEFWFLQNDVYEAVNYDFPYERKSVTKKPLKEMCIMTVPTLLITLEAGVGNKCFPMLLMESRFCGKINDWSSQMYVEATLTLQMAYYNSLLALWEPLIEPVMVRDEHTNIASLKPWELRLEVSMNNVDEALQIQVDSDSSEVCNTQAAMTIDISSSNNLELTVTKTGLEVLTSLSKMLAKAIDKSQIISGEEQAPFKVINSTGLEIILVLDVSKFELVGMSTQSVNLQSGAEVYLDVMESEDDVSATKNLTHILMDVEAAAPERMLTIRVPQMHNIDIKLPVIRADTRYFNMRSKNQNYGLVSSIKVDNGVTIITLSSILQVNNTFNIPVDMYYMRDSGNELEFICSIPPGSSTYVPMKAVYSPTSELFFSVSHYSVTTTPFIWKDLQLNVTVSKNLTCRSKVKKEDLFVIRAVGEMSQVYYENTTKHTMASTIYNISLRPAVILKNCLPINIILCSQNIEAESTIEPGDTLEIPNVEPGQSYIVIRFENYLDKQWSCRNDILLNPQPFSVWTFNSYDSVREVSLDLGMHVLNQNGTFTMSLYCPFWMLNKTGLVLSYRSSDENLNILHHPPFFNGPILFSFNAKNFFGKKKASVRIEQGEWSDKFSIDVAGSSGVVICRNGNKIHQIGVHNILSYNGLTKQITFTPYYVIINNTPLNIECQELERPADPWTMVGPKACCALWPSSELDDKLIKLRMPDTGEITAPFLITESHTTLLKLKQKYGGINVDIQLTEGAIYINLALYDKGMAPALVVNHTKHTMNFWEKESVVIRTLEPDSNMLYTWDNPSSQRVLVWEGGYKKEYEDDLRKDGIGQYPISDVFTVYWVSFLDGMQRVLLFTHDISVAENAQASKQFEVIDKEITVSIYGMGLSVVNNIKRHEILYIGIASTGIVWETCKVNSKRYKQVSTKDNLTLERMYQSHGMEASTSNSERGKSNASQIEDHFEVNFELNTMTKPHKRKIRRRFQTGLWVQMKTSEHQMQIHAKVNRLQIDNQLYDCTFPVLLAPVPPPKSIANNAHKPFAEMSIVQLLIKNSQIRQFKYFKILIQEFHIKVDLGFINALMDIVDTSLQSEQEEKDRFLTDKNRADEPLFLHVSTHSILEQKSFYDLLHFSPLKIHVSFSMTAGSNETSGTSYMPVFLSVLLQGIGVTLTDLQDVIFKLAFFQRDYSFLTQRQLVREATTHYLGQTVKQFYVLVLGLDVIGNPYGLVLGISKGVEDLFYEPFQGAIQGPGEFAEGLMLGVASLFGHTVGGAAGAVSRITGAMGKGIAALTFDKDYQRKRRDQINKRPATVQEGIARGGKGLVMGVFDGVTGVFTKPISGAKEQGVGGFFKGLGKGAVGLVTRPTAGVMDFASTSFETVKRVTDFGHEEVTRLRAPRFIQADCLVKPYNEGLALGNKLLCELEKGKYCSTDIYSCHFTIIEKKEVLLLSTKRIAYIKHNDLFGGWQVEWSYTWPEIDQSKPPTLVPKGVQIFADAKKRSLFNSQDNGKVVLVPQQEIAGTIVEKIRLHML